jgi:Zn-dependent protease with chaperone function
MSGTVSFDFAEYVRRRKTETSDAGGSEESYAYAGDLEAQAYLRRLSPVVAAIESAVRLWKTIHKNELLGHAVLVTPKQFPEVHELVSEAARRLGIALPAVYVTQQMSLNAHTFGTETESYVVLHAGSIDHLSRDELLFVIGHEAGHIQNGHVTLLTAAHYLAQIGSAFFRWMVYPAVLALRSWSRRAEITSDRAGLLCCRDLGVAQRSLIKLALGSQKLYEQIDVEEFLKQLEAGREGVGKYAELLSTHPYIPKRVEALRVFAESRLYRERAAGLAGGLDKATVDARVSQIIKVT